MTTLTFEEFKKIYLDGANQITQDQVQEFEKIHGLKLDDEIERITHSEYKLYLERLEAGE